MNKLLQIVYEENVEHGWLSFTGEDAELLEKKLLAAEAQSTLAIVFTDRQKVTYYIRTDKYLYWTIREQGGEA